jgi:uncharacterized protein (DUF736 family)|tara:strand:- start:499 stop:822 length:324 start_codon:yes stop_codon:yes gene_type:complete
MSTNLNKWDKNSQGKLWGNNNKEKDTQPDFTGSIVVDGVKHSIAAWNNMTENGTAYLGLKISEWVDKPNNGVTAEVKTDQTLEMTQEQITELVGDAKRKQTQDDLPF